MKGLKKNYKKLILFSRGGDTEIERYRKYIEILRNSERKIY